MNIKRIVSIVFGDLTKKRSRVFLILFMILLIIIILPVLILPTSLKGDTPPWFWRDSKGCMKQITVLSKQIKLYLKINTKLPYAEDGSGSTFIKLLPGTMKSEKIHACPGYSRWKHNSSEKSELHDCYTFLNLNDFEWKTLKNVTQKGELLEKIGLPLIWDKYKENHARYSSHGLIVVAGEREILPLPHNEFDNYMNSVKLLIEQKLGKTFDECITKDLIVDLGDDL